MATIRAALDSGVTLLDTADFYGCGHNKMLIASAIGGQRDRVFVQVEFGVLRDPAGGFLGVDARPTAIRIRSPTR
jgi:aryl-alcohol dehydrogenase-like predicted oxidoreductase